MRKVRALSSSTPPLSPLLSSPLLPLRTPYAVSSQDSPSLSLSPPDALVPRPITFCISHRFCYGVTDCCTSQARCARHSDSGGRWLIGTRTGCGVQANTPVESSPVCGLAIHLHHNPSDSASTHNPPYLHGALVLRSNLLVVPLYVILEYI
ncbi:hypothetical protein B0H16DRAFT_1585459 [Mycena metata]|uniref:Uncharacterized protein n=1 Tax=Mycena metata TaxID=1033252 RepID=A0AAD7HWP5_9AGAR|nr:hypothetical protein B0H16DRAFT_1585459 [Mycena metata]